MKEGDLYLLPWLPQITRCEGSEKNVDLNLEYELSIFDC